MRVQSLGWEDPLEKGMATHSSILAAEFHGQRSLRGYSSPRGRKQPEATSHACMYCLSEQLPHFIFLIAVHKI